MGTFAADLDLLVQAIQTVSSTKNYWLIRDSHLIPSI